MVRAHVQLPFTHTATLYIYSYPSHVQLPFTWADTLFMFSTIVSQCDLLFRLSSIYSTLNYTETLRLQDGRLKAGDQLLEVDGKSLVGLTQERAADLMKHTGQVVDLHVVKQGAIYHGLATLLNQPTPPMSRANVIGPPPQDNPSYMVQSKSTPMLNGWQLLLDSLTITWSVFCLLPGC